MADAEQRWMVDQLEELVRHESPSGAVERLDALRDVLVARMAEAGVELTARPGPAGDHLVASLGGREDGGGHVLVLGHYDTVWPVGRLVDSPFTVRVGVATGPGVFDMKAGLAMLLWVLHHLDETPHRPVRIVLTADEEIGSPSGADVVRAECAGAAAVLALEPPLAAGRLKVGRRGVSRVELLVTGREAHAGLDPEAGVSAIDELVDQLVILRERLPERPTRSVNVGRFRGGSGANVVAGQAGAELGLRFTTDADERELRAVLDDLTPVRAGAHVAVRTLTRRPAWEPTSSRALAEHVVATAGALGERVDVAVSGGAGDANLPGSLGLPTVDGLGPRGGGAHAPDERVELATLLPRARLLRELLTKPLRTS
jgi:glutamate carboxypeptidase